jgi:hypothetical protein
MHRCGSSDSCIPNWVSYCFSSVSLVVVGARAVLLKVLGDWKLELLSSLPPPQQEVST